MVLFSEALILPHGQPGDSASTIHEQVHANYPASHVLGSSRLAPVFRGNLPKDLQDSATSLGCSMRLEQHKHDFAKDTTFKMF